MKSTFANSEGPNRSNGSSLEKYRRKIKQEGGDGAAIMKIAGINMDGKQTLSSKQLNAIAALKVARHFYLQKKFGAKSVWIWAGPFSYHKLIFKEFEGLTPTAAKAKLDKIDEVYPKRTRKHMGNGVKQALAWCQKCSSKLSKPDKKTKELVGRWFIHTSSDDKVDKACKTLLDGFKKVSALLNSNKLIFSDDPIDRMKGDVVSGKSHSRANSEDFAFVAGEHERLDVVYIQNAALRRWGTKDEAWMATLTIIHELTHRVLSTKDVVYDFTGLQPSEKLTYEHAIKNADSWAYFAADLNGKLPETARDKYYKMPAQLRQKYLDSIGS